jgi:hypothetical protein
MQHAPISSGSFNWSFATRIPEWVYTKGRRRKPSVEEKSKWDKYRPDILMIAGTNKRPIKRREADVVEIKYYTYCRGTDPTMQQSRAENQHDAAATTEGHRSVSLMQSLRDAGYRPNKVRLHVILLGVGATIYSSMHTTLKQLGMKRQATANVAGKLHKHATLYARRIMQTKWNHCEFVLKRDTGQGQIRIILCYHGEGGRDGASALSDLRLLLNQPPRKLGGSYFFFCYHGEGTGGRSLGSVGPPPSP